MKCHQVGCENPAAYRYTWPGKNESGICEQHVEKARAVAESMGFYLQILPLEEQPEGEDA